MKNKANAATITVIILNPVNRNIIITDIILLKTVLFLPQIFLGKTSQNKFSINLKYNPKIESSNIFMYHPIVIIQIILICPTTSALPRILFSDRSSASSATSYFVGILINCIWFIVSITFDIIFWVTCWIIIRFKNGLISCSIPMNPIYPCTDSKWKWETAQSFIFFK